MIPISCSCMLRTLSEEIVVGFSKRCRAAAQGGIIAQSHKYIPFFSAALYHGIKFYDLLLVRSQGRPPGVLDTVPSPYNLLLSYRFTPCRQNKA